MRRNDDSRLGRSIFVGNGGALASERQIALEILLRHVFQPAFQDDAALFHDEDVIGEAAGEVDVLFDEQNRHVAGFFEALDDGFDLQDDGGLDALGGFVEEEELGAGDEGAGDGQLLLLAAAEKAALAVQHGLQDREKLENVVCDGGGGQALGDEADAKIFEDGHVGENFSALRDIADALPGAAVGRQCGERLVVERDGAGTGPQQAHDAFQQGGLADAVAAHEANDLADRHVQVDVPQHLAVAVTDAQAVDGKHDRLTPSQIDFDHPGVALHVRHRALAENPALVQHRHPVGCLAHEFHIVFNHQHGVFPGQVEQNLAGLLAFLPGHAGDRLVQQKKRRLLHHDHADFQPLHFAVRQRPGLVLGLLFQPQGLQRRINSVCVAPVHDTEQGRHHVAAVAQGEGEIVDQGEVPEHGGGLEFAPDAQHGDLVFLQLAEIGSLAEDDAPGVRFGPAADDVEQGRLAGAVGTDQRPQLAVVHVKIHLFQSLEAVERDGDILDVHDGAALFHVSLPVSGRTGLRLTPAARWGSAPGDGPERRQGGRATAASPGGTGRGCRRCHREKTGRRLRTGCQG